MAGLGPAIPSSVKGERSPEGSGFAFACPEKDLK
jgi:hypothetical protein